MSFSSHKENQSQQFIFLSEFLHPESLKKLLPSDLTHMERIISFKSRSFIMAANSMILWTLLK